MEKLTNRKPFKVTGILTPAEWFALTVSDFASYDAIVIPDQALQGAPGVESTYYLNATKKVWSPAIQGNIVIMGTDPNYAYMQHNPPQGPLALIEDSLRFVTDGPSTGLYFVVPRSYKSIRTPMAPIVALSEFGDFEVSITDGCYDNTHIVNPPTSFSSLTDASLSNWDCSVSEVFETFPSPFSVFAAARLIVYSHSAKLRARAVSYASYLDIPYILTRGSVAVASSQQTNVSVSIVAAFNSTPTSSISSSTSTWSSIALFPNTSTSTETVTPATSDPEPVAIFTSSDFPSALPTSATSTKSQDAIITEPATSGKMLQDLLSSQPVTVVEANESKGPGVATSVIPYPSFTESQSFYRESTIIEPFTSELPSAQTIDSFPTSVTASDSAIETTPGNSFPEPVAAFSFFGCAGSDDGYLAFTMALSSPAMDLEMCASACENQTYAGVYDR